MEEILAIAGRSLDEFDIVNLVTAVHRLARYSHLLRAGPASQESAPEGQGARMVNRLVGSLAEKVTELRVQQLANIAWSFARLAVRHEPLWDAISASSIASIH